MKESDLEKTLAFQIKAKKLPTPEREHRFHETRKWRFDFAWPSLKVAVEVEGGSWTGGAHTRGRHFESDCEKYNAAVEAGWRVLRFPNHPINDGRAIAVIERVVRGATAT